MAQLQRLVVAPHQLQDQRILLKPEQQHYLQRVLRLGEGDRFIAMNGQGQSWLAQLVQADLSKLQADILEAVAQATELPVYVTLVAALPKGNGFDDVVRQATELGVTQIEPIISDRTYCTPVSKSGSAGSGLLKKPPSSLSAKPFPLFWNPNPSPLTSSSFRL